MALKPGKRKRRRTRHVVETDSGISLSTMSPVDSVGGAGERNKRRRRRKRKSRASKLGQCLQHLESDSKDEIKEDGAVLPSPPSVAGKSGLSRFKGLQDVVTIYQSKFAPKATNGVVKKVEQKNLHMEHSSSESESSSDDDDDDDDDVDAVVDPNDDINHTTHTAPKSQLAHSAYVLNRPSSSSSDNIVKPQGLVT